MQSVATIIFLTNTVPNSLEFNHPAAIFCLGDIHLDGISRQDILDQLRPLQKAQGTTVKVILIAHVVDLFQFLDTVEVEMIDQLIGCFRAILIDDGKGWRSDYFFHPQLFADGLDEGRLAGTHLAVKGKDTMVADVFGKLPCCFTDVF